MPDMETKLYTEKGDAYCQKIDIFKEIMWFSYANAPAQWMVLPVAKVKEILAINKKKERVAGFGRLCGRNGSRSREKIRKCSRSR